MSYSVTDVDAIFAAALQLSSPNERGEYVQRVCGENSELRKRVDDLLAAYSQAGDFLQRPPATVLHHSDEDIQAAPGTVIGPYKLLQQIGDGGMGVVFMAEQTEPIHRTVAIKIIKPGMDTRQVIARFEAERQALAVMDHPNIAKVLDAGTTDKGRPYFVMDLVKGIAITKYCDEKQLSLRERLELFKPVCEAVQHAHQKGIIHRDIKPTNVLVAEYDGKPVPKIIDFGVAKATAQRLTERTMFTEFGQVIGTVEYMSPEQASFNQLDIDTRSDIYSLGVLLYELLTGTTPFERQRLREAAFDEVLRIIRDEEPQRPSTRLSTNETLPTIAANRHTEPARLSKDVSGELDWIVMKCLEKDRNRRYETANGLSRDIERYLRDEPVQACPPSAVYRFGKFARRNKAALAVASAAIAMLLLLVAGLSISNRLIAAQRAQAEAERERADAERQRAEENLLRARVAVRDILFEAALGRGKWAQLPRDLRKAFAAKTTDFYQSLLHEESSSPSLQYETAVGYRSLAVLHNSLKNIEAAEKFARQAVEMLDRLATEHPNVMEYRNQQAYSHYVLGATLTHVTRSGVAEPAFRRSATLYESVLSQWPDAAGCYSELGLCYDALIRLQKGRGATEEAEQTQNRLIGLLSKVPVDSANFAELQSKLALALLKAGRLNEATEAMDSAVRTADVNDSDQRRKVADACLNVSAEALKGANRDVRMAEAAARTAIKLVPDYGMAYAKLSVALRDQGKLDEAVAASRKGIELQPNYARGHFELAYILRNQGKIDEALACARKAIEIDPKSPYAYAELGLTLKEQRKYDEAIDALRKTIELQPDYANGHATLGSILQSQGKLDEAVAAYRKAIELDSENAFPHNNLGNTLKHLGRLDEAEAEIRKAIELQPNANHYCNLGSALIELGKIEEAIAACRKAIELNPQHSMAHNNLGIALNEQGKVDEAVATYRKAIDLDSKNALPHTNLGNILRTLRRLDEAATEHRKAIEIDPALGVLYGNLSTVLIDLGKLDDAVTASRKAIELQPSDPTGHVNLHLALGKLGKREEANAALNKAIALHLNIAGQLNGWAWFLATTTEAKKRDPGQAVEPAKKAAELAPDDGNLWNTLGVAHFRLGESQPAIDALEKSMKLRQGGTAEDWLFMAMAHWRLGHTNEARQWHVKAVEWMDKNAPKNDDLVRFRAEAAELLGISQPQPSSESSDKSHKPKPSNP